MIREFVNSSGVVTETILHLDFTNHESRITEVPMAERKPLSRFSNAEIKAGVFLTFCMALFIAMLFVLGKFGRVWRGRQEIHVAFARVNAIRPESPVKYNGLEVG